MNSLSSRRPPLSLIALAPLFLSVAGCAGPEVDSSVAPPDVGTTTSALIPMVMEFSNDAYEDALAAALAEAQAASGSGGYSYAMFRGGQLVGSGQAGSSRPGVPWTADTPFSMMSMGKTITAAALVRLLAERPGVSLESRVVDYLPAAWTPDPDFAPVTFRMLLSHESGLTTGVDSWTSVKQQVETNVRPPNSSVIKDGLRWDAGVGTYFYSNTNYTLARVVMPYIMDPETAAANEALGLAPVSTALAYRAKVVDSLFAPIGLGFSQVDVKPIGPTPAGFYDDSGTNVWYVPNDGSSIFEAGAGHWTLSSKSFARFLDALYRGRYNVISGGVRHNIWMEMSESGEGTNGLGVYRVTGERGTYFTHNGGWSNGTSGACARWMVYPNGLAAVWVMNSVIDNANGDTTCPLSSSSTKMVSAYDEAWLPAKANP